MMVGAKCLGFLGVGIGLFFSIAGVESAQASIPPAHSTAVRRFGRVTVGDQIDGLPWIARERGEIRPLHRRAKFFAYLFRSDLPDRCVNLQCGTFARQVLVRGGLLIGGADRELSHEIGWDGEPNPPTSLLVVSNRGGKVTGIYKGVSDGNLAEVLERIEALETGAN